MNDEKVTLATLAKGGAAELWEHVLRKVLDNIADPNTDPQAVRELKLTVKITPNEDRTTLRTTVLVEGKMAAPKAAETTLYMGVESGGKRFAVEHNPVQQSLFDPAAVKTGRES